MKARSYFIASASVLLAGSAMLAVSPATSASASVSLACNRVPGGTVCHYIFTGEGATPAAAEANAATKDPGCGDAQLIAGPEVLSSGLWYVEYAESCDFID